MTDETEPSGEPREPAAETTEAPGDDLVVDTGSPQDYGEPNDDVVRE